MLIDSPNRLKTLNICTETVDTYLAFKFIPDWFIISKILEKFHGASLANDDILFFDEDFSKVTFLG